HGNVETGTSAASAAVAEIAQPNLTVTIDAAPVEGTAVTATVVDPSDVGGDIGSATITYKWYADDGTGPTLVHTGVGNNTYTQTEADEGKTLTVTASFTDSH